MKAIDFHIHTVATKQDSFFEFSLEVLKEYVDIHNLDAIAITNHNLFDQKQFEEIQKALPIKVFPGIEVDLLTGHMLVIAENRKKTVEEFAVQCQEIAKIYEKNNRVTVSEFKNTFPNYCEYLLIPHYDKKPIIPNSAIDEFSDEIFCSEVKNPKSFFIHRRREGELTPLLFSDLRSKKGLTTEEMKYKVGKTYVDIDEINISKLKLALKQKNNVSLNKDKEGNAFEINNDGLVVKQGINLVFGKRASGKTELLKSIKKGHGDDALHIPQFFITSKSDDKDFKQYINKQHANVRRDILKPFDPVLTTILDIDKQAEEKELSNFTETLLRSAEQESLEDEYSRCELYRTGTFDIRKDKSLYNMLDALETIIENKKYRADIVEIIDIQSLKILFNRFYSKYYKDTIKTRVKEHCNNIIRNIRDDLSKKTAVSEIEDINLTKIVENELKIQTFNSILRKYRQEHDVSEYCKNIHDFRVNTRIRNFSNVSEVKEDAKISQQIAMKEEFELFYSDNPYAYVHSLKDKSISHEEILKSLFKVEFEVVDSKGHPLSGGQRSEYILLDTIDEALKYNLLLIDEPESSFDNKFLKNQFIPLLEDISNQVPVLLSTHNSVLGVLSNPAQLLYTRREEDGQFEIYTGSLTSKDLKGTKDKQRKLSTYVALTELMEAGILSYQERGEIYEGIKDRE